MAIGLLGLSPEEFCRIRLGQLLEALTARQEEKMAERRHLGELVRGAALRLFNVQLDPSDRITDPAKFWEMPWDETKEADLEKEISGWSQEERDRRAKEFLQRIGDV